MKGFMPKHVHTLMRQTASWVTFTNSVQRLHCWCSHDVHDDFIMGSDLAVCSSSVNRRMTETNHHQKCYKMFLYPEPNTHDTYLY